MQDAPLREAVEGSSQDKASYWIKQIEDSRTREKDWREQVRKIVHRYRDDQPRSDYRMNILWANTDTLQSALMPNVPRPDIRRRASMQDNAGRLAAQALERAIEYNNDQYDVGVELNFALQSALLAGRGCVRVREKSEIGPVMIPLPDGSLLEEEDIVDQKYCLDYVAWDDLALGTARRWQEVPWIAFRHMFDKDEVRKLFGAKIANEIAYTHVPLETDRTLAKEPDLVEVWEVWDKRNKKRNWVSGGLDRLLDSENDPYDLKGFYPIARPLQFILTPDCTVPIPEFAIYQDQVEELDIITNRIAKLTEAMKRRGIYDAAMDGLKRLADASDNEFVPVDNYAAYMEKGGLAALFSEESLQNLIMALNQLYGARQQCLQIIYEITGISDIMRGEARDRETATSARSKMFFGSLRLVNRKKELARFVRDTYRIMGEMIAERCDPQILAAQTQVPINEEVIALLRDERDRGYRVDIETDESIAYDEQGDKQSRMELFQALTTFVGTVAPLVQQGTISMDTAKGLVMFAMRPFKESRQIEEGLMQMQPPKPPEDPQKQMEAALAQAEMMKAQVARQNAAEKAQLQAQIEQMKAQLAMQKLQMEQMKEQAKQGVDVANLQLKAQDLDLKDKKIEYDQEYREQDLATRILTTQIMAETQKEIAEERAEKVEDDGDL